MKMDPIANVHNKFADELIISVNPEKIASDHPQEYNP